jgi:hypothetical protein
MKHYPLREFVTHRFGLRDVESAMQKSIEAESMKVVLEPWQSMFEVSQAISNVQGKRNE